MRKIIIEITAVLIIAIGASLIFNVLSGNRINILKKFKKIEDVDQTYNIEKIDIEIFRYYLEKEGTIVLDARPESDFTAGHIPGATSFSVNNFETLFRERGQLLKLGKTILIYCSGPTCTDSHQLAVKLYGKGIREIFVFSGGMEEWLNSEFETTDSGMK